MSEYDFKPDFQSEWGRSGINREALAWLTLGVSPSAGERLIEVGNKNERTEEERRFIQSFDTFSLHEIGKITLQKLYQDYDSILRVVTAEDKEAFINEAYTQNFDIHPGLCAYLQSIDKMPNNPDLERYIDHSQYKDDLEVFLNNLQSYSLCHIK